MAEESSSKSAFYQKLVAYGIDAKVSEELDACQQSGNEISQNCEN